MFGSCEVANDIFIAVLVWPAVSLHIVQTALVLQSAAIQHVGSTVSDSQLGSTYVISFTCCIIDRVLE